jgi:NAD+ synthase (glutamine-hydrolysing)
LVRVAVATPSVAVGDSTANRAALEHSVRAAADAGAVLVLTPELGLTGYTAADLFAQEHLLAAAWAALEHLADALGDLPHVAAVVGLPVRVADGRLYNCAAVLAGGRIAGLVPKQHLPNRAEFYEDRWFTRAAGRSLPTVHRDIPFGTDLVFDLGVAGAVLGVEVCEDLWAVEPPSGRLALAGATLLANPSASPELLGKAAYRTDLVRQQSARCLAAYLYAGAGPGESSTDVVYGGHSLVAENGTVLAQTPRLCFAPTLAVADVDIARLLHERVTNAAFANADPSPCRVVAVGLSAPTDRHADLLRPLSRCPFVPDDPSQRRQHCEEIFAIQSTGLARRLLHTGARHVTIGISGGLDSTLALLVAVRAFDALGLERSGIVSVTMPGFGTSDRTLANARGLMAALGTDARELPIGAAVSAHFADIGHDPAVHDVVFENAQARERTQILMDLANRTGGFVVGTGDLSEAALGWMTFNGDHMSMYHVNAGVPKTLVRYLVTWAADEVFDGEVRRLLHDVVDTPISPELLPLADGKVHQRTEDTIGPYELHDFFLFHVVRYGARPAKVFALACHAFAGEHAPAAIARWFEVFLRRFFAQQYKRSSMPDGPKVGSVALSPRADWRMPSDASPATWLAELGAAAAEMERLQA